ncbi:MAG: class I SAM-dependent rRNA methyltransferase [Actinomycetota bacterium]|nr:class I SAM-dependent rRNA methyltransferase [Actinomycetota bacterium]MDA3020669.1 class I SAM-dependent rRNA methyltransferase [Actinomycetota bacterium]
MTIEPSASLHLKADRDRSLKRGHPWILSGAVAKIDGDPQPGDTIRIIAANGTELATASYSPFSALRARVWSFNPNVEITAGFIAETINKAVAQRNSEPELTHTCRLIFGDADGLPGLTVDRYGEVAVMEINSVGIERWRDAVVSTLMKVEGITCVYERSEGADREREGLTPRNGLAAGVLPAKIYAVEGNEKYIVNVEEGHKTGFYIDQRDSRKLVATLAPGLRVLNVFGYTGSFSVVAAKNGAASVTTVESSGPALELAKQNAELNGVDVGEVIEGDAFEVLRRMRDRRAEFDLIILDPPKYSASAKHIERATRKYKDINLVGIKLLAPGGKLMTFSCSQSMDTDLFQKVVAGAAVDAKRDLRITHRLGQPVDHPVHLHFPESEYLKGLLLQAD